MLLLVTSLLPHCLTTPYVIKSNRDFPPLSVTSKDFLHPETFNILQMLKASLQVNIVTPRLGSRDKLLLHYRNSEKHLMFKTVIRARAIANQINV